MAGQYISIARYSTSVLFLCMTKTMIAQAFSLVCKLYSCMWLAATVEILCDLPEEHPQICCTCKGKGICKFNSRLELFSSQCRPVSSWMLAADSHAHTHTQVLASMIIDGLPSIGQHWVEVILSMAFHCTSQVHSKLFFISNSSPMCYHLFHSPSSCRIVCISILFAFSFCLLPSAPAKDFTLRGGTLSWANAQKIMKVWSGSSTVRAHPDLVATLSSACYDTYCSAL